MREAAADLEFEEAARLRDEIKRLEEADLGVPQRGSLAERIRRTDARHKSRRTRARGKAKAKARSVARRRGG